uniref:leucine-rich repeat protein n=1 Tax=Methanomethylophilus alvi TaxID=1291540 RepID=UPI0037DC64FD
MMQKDYDQSGNGLKSSNRPHVRVVIGFAMAVFIIISLLSVIIPSSDYSDADSTAEITVVANDDVMGSVTGSGTYAVNSTQIITASANTGYYFVQWNDGNTQTIRTIAVLENTTYVAQFMANQYTVTLNNQSPTMPGDTSVTATYAQNLPAVVVPVKTDYEFRGYYTGVGGSGDKYINADGTPAREYFLTTDVILYAYWYQNTHVVTLHSVGADDEGTTSAVAVVDLNFPNISAPTRTGYLFAGYYTGVNGSGTQYVDSSGNGTRNYDIDSDTILYAKWISLNGITIVDCGTDSEGCLVWIFDSVNQLSIFGSCGIPDYSKNNSPWHSYGNSIETIEIGSTISSIGTYAFSGCTSLEDLVIPDSVTSLGYMCFENCTGLRSLTIPISLR